MNDKIINVKNVPDSHKEGRRTQSAMKENTMTTHCRGMGVTHEINGRENFRIIHVVDGEGNTTPQGNMENVHIWHQDSKSEFEMRTHQKDFWF